MQHCPHTTRTTDGKTVAHEDEEMAEQTELSGAELIFAQRMLSHLMAGKSAEEAASAVIEDDARLFNAFFERAHDSFIPGYNDHTGRTYRTRDGKGDLIASEITRTVYERLRAA